MSEIVTIDVYYREQLRNGFYVIMNRLGIIKTKSLKCNVQNVCSFTFKVTKNMLPSSSVWIYEILNEKDLIIGGSTNIDFDGLGSNYVSNYF